MLNRLATLFQDKVLANVVFSVGAEEFPAHVAFLAPARTVFMVMFQNHFQENRNRIVYVENVKCQTL